MLGFGPGLARLARSAWPGLVLAIVLQVGIAQAAWMVPPPPNRAKDFCIVKRDGWFHCFYILRDGSVPGDSTERELGHAVSRDLYQWTQLPPVLQVRPGSWDNAKVWAPSIVEADGVYYMFYTGVTVQPGTYAFYQQVGIATSTDLMNWNRPDEPLLACDRVRWTYCDPLSYTGGEFRDPFVMKDPATGGWLMYYTARPASDSSMYVAGMAASSGDLTQWENREALWITGLPWSGSPVVESVHLFRRGGLYYLMFSGSGAEPLKIATGPDPTGAPETWTFRGTLGAMLGFDTHLWFASEQFSDGKYEYLAFINYDRVDIRRIQWGPDWTFTLPQPPQFHVHSMSWSEPQAHVGQAVKLTIEAVNTFGRGVRLEAVTLDAEGNETPVPLASMGIPDSIPMPGPTLEYWWTAHGYPDPVEPGSQVRLVVRMADHTASTPPITVVPDPWRLSGEPSLQDGTPRVPRAYEEPDTQPATPTFRAVRGSPLAAPQGGAALLVDLAAPAAVRLEVFDLAGRRVRTLRDQVLPAGATVLPWDGREDNGAAARRGIYFARLTSPHGQRTVRVSHLP